MRVYFAAMQIDQNPKDYRTAPVKGEPVFLPGGLKLLGLFFLMIAVGLAASVMTSPAYWFSCTFITKTCA